MQSTRTVWLGTGKRAQCRIVQRAALRPGQRVAGPAVVEQMDTTTLVLDGQVARMDEYRNLVITEAS